MYSLGSSEEVTGKWLREFGRRDELVIATKAFSRAAASRKRTTTFMPSRVTPADAIFCSRSAVRISLT